MARLLCVGVMEFSASVEVAAREFIENNPAQYYKAFLREMKEKNKLCDAFSSYVDDIASLEDNFGKCLVKVVLSIVVRPVL